MNIKFFRSCYDLAAFATCIEKDVDRRISDHIVENRIEFTDNFFAVARYEALCSDYLSPSEYENHKFSIVFVRDDDFLEKFEFETKVDGKNVGSLANPAVTMGEKLNFIKEYGPSRSTKFENFFKKTKLAPHEQAMVIEKCRKIFNSACVDKAAKTTRK